MVSFPLVGLFRANYPFVKALDRIQKYPKGVPG